MQIVLIYDIGFKAVDKITIIYYWPIPKIIAFISSEVNFKQDILSCLLEDFRTSNCTKYKQGIMYRY